MLCKRLRRESQCRAVLLYNDRTDAEIRLSQILTKMKIAFYEQFVFPIGTNQYRIVDFYLKRPLKAVIEVDGDYHLSEKVKEKDKKKDDALIKHHSKFKIIRVSNREVLGPDAESFIASKLREVLGKRLDKPKGAGVRIKCPYKNLGKGGILAGANIRPPKLTWVQEQEVLLMDKAFRSTCR